MLLHTPPQLKGFEPIFEPRRVPNSPRKGTNSRSMIRPSPRKGKRPKGSTKRSQDHHPSHEHPQPQPLAQARLRRRLIDHVVVVRSSSQGDPTPQIVTRHPASDDRAPYPLPPALPMFCCLEEAAAPKRIRRWMSRSSTPNDAASPKFFPFVLTGGEGEKVRADSACSRHAAISQLAIASSLLINLFTICHLVCPCLCLQVFAGVFCRQRHRVPPGPSSSSSSSSSEGTGSLEAMCMLSKYPVG